MPTHYRNFLASLRAGLSRQDMSDVAIVDTESDREATKLRKKPWHAPKILDLGPRLDFDERADDSSGGQNCHSPVRSQDR